MILASKPHQTPNFCHKARPNPIINRLNLLRIYHYPFFETESPNNAKEFNQNSHLENVAHNLCFPTTPGEIHEDGRYNLPYFSNRPKDHQ